MNSNQVVALIHVERTNKKNEKYEYLSTQNNSVPTGISEENPRESGISKIIVKQILT